MEKKIKIRICVGTHCYVMGNHDLKDLKDQLPEYLRDKVYVEGAVCLGCDGAIAKPQPPYVEINGELIPQASLEKVTGTLTRILEKQ